MVWQVINLSVNKNIFKHCRALTHSSQITVTDLAKYGESQIRITSSLQPYEVPKLASEVNRISASCH